VELELAPGQRADAAQTLLAGVVEIVDDRDPVARVQQLQAGVAADVAGAAGDEEGTGRGGGVGLVGIGHGVNSRPGRCGRTATPRKLCTANDLMAVK